MEENEIETQACKLPRVENGSDGGRKRFHSWHPSSRIIRVSRASGGKDRHSKVMTSKGSRDRRVRLSVSTAIQFYDLQDRLGYDQPSKAVEWLIKSAADAIAELPSLNNTCPPDSDEKRASGEQGFDSADAEVDGENATNHQQNKNNQSQNISLSKSACSSTSETSKCSGLSLSRSVNRVKARERARERTAKEKEKEKEKENESHNNIVHNVKPISQTVSFTELLTGGMNNAVPTASSPNQNHAREQWSSSLSAPMDCLSSGLLGASSSLRTHHNHGFSVSQIQLGHNSLPETMSFHNHNNSSYHNYSQLQQFSLIPADHQQQLMSANRNDDSLNFGISGYNRGTLQSNSPSLLPHFLDGSTVPFFIGTATTIHNHHHKFSSDHKGKTKY